MVGVMHGCQHSKHQSLPLSQATIQQWNLHAYDTPRNTSAGLLHTRMGCQALHDRSAMTFGDAAMSFYVTIVSQRQQSTPGNAKLQRRLDGRSTAGFGRMIADPI